MSCSDVCLDMDADCDCDNEFYRENLVKARKIHQCCECHDIIDRGESYAYAVGKSDGRIWSERTCAICYEIRLALVCGSWIFGQLWEEIEQDVFPAWRKLSPIDCLAKIDSLDARNKLRTRYEEWKQ